MAIVYCKNCKQCGESKLKGSGWITFILILCCIAPGLIYMIWRRSGLGLCKFCSSADLVPASQKPVEQISKNPSFQQVENVRQINCPDCRELIRFDARKCKHCGSFVENQKN